VLACLLYARRLRQHASCFKPAFPAWRLMPSMPTHFLPRDLCAGPPSVPLSGCFSLIAQVKLRQHAIDVAVSQGTRALVGKKLFVYHFPPGVENQPLLRGGWMRGGIKCYLEGTGEYLVSLRAYSDGCSLQQPCCAQTCLRAVA
jgi:hypothetical protein